VGHNHLMIWKLIDKMRQEISVDIAKVELNDIGIGANRGIEARELRGLSTPKFRSSPPSSKSSN